MSKTEDEKKMSKLKKLQKCSKAITKSVNVKNVELDQIKLEIHQLYNKNYNNNEAFR